MLAALLLILPLLLGGNRGWATGLAALACWVALAGWALLVLRAPAAAAGHLGASAALSGARAPLLCLLGLGGLVGLQLLAAEGLLPAAWATEDPYATQDYLLRTLLYTGAFAAVLLGVTTEQRLRWLLLSLVGAGLVQAFVGAALLSGGQDFSLFHTPFEWYGRATGTFPNADHLAGFMELCLAAGLGLMVAQFGDDGQRQPDGWRGKTLALAQFAMSPKMLLRLLLIVLVIALVLTRSRMGNAAFFITLLLVGLLVALRSTKLRRPALWLVASMVVVDIFIIGQLVGLEKVVTRLQGTDMALPELAASGVVAPPDDVSDSERFREESLSSRLTPVLAALQLVPQRPVLGWGGGSFEAVFPKVRTPDVIPYQFNYAHSDYAQQAVEVGLLGLALWLGVGLLAGWRAWLLLDDQQPRLHRGVAVSTFMALGCLGLHSVVDFNLQIPANALTMTVLLALPFTLKLQRRSRGAARVRAEELHARPWRVQAVSAAVLLVAAGVLWWGGRLLVADWLAAPTWDVLTRHADNRGKLRPVPAEDLERALQRVEQSLALVPDAPQPHLRAGHFLLVLAARQPAEGATAEQRAARPAQVLQWRQRALAHFQQAARLRPQDPRPWLGVAQSQFYLGQAPLAWDTWRKALSLGPNERAVLQLALDQALPTWHQAPADVQQWLMRRFELGDAELRKEINDEAAEFGLSFVDE
ncbi:O-antigen ligase family protein [Ideonella alba]|uniref:O-antigen ligase family protein n=1 Tax=Ideonella alba TaxID=2824118 RepID=UPI0028732A52|nr:O-antigen ligase family protein [Ideonella alba]